MRHRRAKAARKTLKFFSLNCNVKPPFKILVDGNFLATSVKQKVPLFDRISKTLQNEEFTLYVCRSALDELNALPGPVFEEARQFGLDECIIIEREDIRPLVAADSSSSSTTTTTTRQRGGGGDANGKTNTAEASGKGGGGGGTPAEDIQSLVSLPPISSATTTSKRSKKTAVIKHDHNNTHNPQGYIVASQDETLSDILRNIPNVPQMHLSRGVLMFESPSAATRRKANFRERGKQMTGGGMMTGEERELIAKTRREERTKKRKEVDGQESGADGMRKKRKAKGPNPLSCKKKKGGERGGGGERNNDNKRSRRKK